MVVSSGGDSSQSVERCAVSRAKIGLVGEESSFRSGDAWASWSKGSFFLLYSDSRSLFFFSGFCRGVSFSPELCGQHKNLVVAA